MRKYEDMMNELKQFNELSDAATECSIRDMNEIEEIRSMYSAGFEATEAGVGSMADNAKAICNNKIAERKEFARRKVSELKNIISSVKDPHFHRMEKKYSRNIRGNHVAVSDLDAAELMRKANSEMLVIQERVGRLNQAFIPAGVSGAIGAMVHPYRKGVYMRIIESRNKILDYIEPLLDTRDLDGLIAEVNEVYNTRLASEQAKLAEQLDIIPNMLVERKQTLLDRFNRGLDLLVEQTSVFSNHYITMGAYVYNTSFSSLFLESGLGLKSGVAIDDESVSFIVGFDCLRNNYLYMHSSDGSYHKHFSSLAVDLLSGNTDNEVIFVDVKGLGSGYSVLNKLTSNGYVKIWSTANQVSQGLDELEIWISNIYSENLSDTYDCLEDYNADHSRKKPERYVFIDDMKGNIDQREYEKMSRIIKNGRKAGVYIITSVSEGDISDRNFCGFYGEIQANMVLIEADNMMIRNTDHSYIVLKCSFERSKIDALYTALLDKEERSEVIPIGKYLPGAVDDWHKSSSAKEVVIPFGIDSNGRIAVFKISSEKPYGMIIGDPRHGKSKLMHSIIMMVTSYYSEDEVKVAVMDLKDGAEFNVYAKAGILPIECVLNDEDPDAMLSFLKYYVSEMHRCQELFEQLEDRTGVIIQKYEDYRSTNDDIGNSMPAMPRLLLLIDEFQTLFDGSSSASYMSELVRKGATYGIHVILSSQRAVSSNPRNGFTADLKDYFTSRFVFKCPQAAARSVLSERCADTGRENSGIHKASLLSKGHVIFNNYMGQNEADNCEVQCFYASPDAVSQFVGILGMLKGGGDKVLFRKNAKSELNTSSADGWVYLGNSVRVHHDAATGSCDYIKDDMTIAFSMESDLKNMIVSGTDMRCVNSLLMSLHHYAELNSKSIKVNLFGRSEGIIIPEDSDMFTVNKYESITEQVEGLQSVNDVDGVTVNLLIEPDSHYEFAQSPGGIRKSLGADALKQVLVADKNMFTVVYTKNFRNLRSSLQYVIAECPIRLASVGDAENIRMSTSENVHVGMGDFDIPRKDAIKAYYYNKETEKYGKVIMYCA